MAKFRAILEIDEEQLKQTRIEAIGEEEAKNESLEEAVSQELGWVNQSGISLYSIKAEDEDQRILDSLAEITCPDGDDNSIERDKAIIAYLRNADEKTLDEMAHGHEFELDGKKYEIVMWENCDHFTLRSLCKHIGL
jgi:hypothetical protein